MLEINLIKACMGIGFVQGFLEGVESKSDNNNNVPQTSYNEFYSWDPVTGQLYPEGTNPPTPTLWQKIKYNLRR